MTKKASEVSEDTKSKAERALADSKATLSEQKDNLKSRVAHTAEDVKEQIG
jgi:vacuolar-type H+-ATPase subunit E/Vma4